MKRIAINFGSGFVPGLDAVVRGAALAAHGAGCELVGIRDGYDGVLEPDRYSEGGRILLTPALVSAGSALASVLGTAARNDPFHMRSISAEGAVEEVDRSDALLGALEQAGIEGVISVVGGSAVTGLHALSVAFKLHRRGLRTVCIPKSVENEVAGVPLALGYNSVLSCVGEHLTRIRAAALDAGRLAVVEVPGQHAGWLALQAGMSALADVVLLPEISADLACVSATLDAHQSAGRTPALVVVAEGARLQGVDLPSTGPTDALRASLAPNADPALGGGSRVIDRSGTAAHAVAEGLARLTGREALPIVLGLLARTGVASQLDRQLGLAYGASAVRALLSGSDGVMLAFDPPKVHGIPMRDALSRVRAVASDSELVHVARALGISLGDGSR